MKEEPQEYLDLVDENDNVIGKAPRSEVRARNLLHRGVGILVFNSRGELYVHKRTETKDIFPGMYDMLVGGTVRAGESYEEAAAREAAEELGIRGVPLRYLFSYLYEGPKNRCITKIFEVCYDGPMVHQPEEVAWGRFYPVSEVLNLMERLPFVPDGSEIFREYLRRRLGESERT